MTQIVYAVGYGQMVKIGITSDLASRLRAMQNGCPEKIEAFYWAEAPSERAILIERACHAALQSHRVRGEWFQVAPCRAVAIVTAAVADGAGEWPERPATPLLPWPELLTPRQARAARTLLGWSQKQLADAAKLGVRTVMDFESEKRETTSGTRAMMSLALERGGVELLDREGVCRQ